MSTAPENPLKRYISGRDRYANFAEDILDIQLLEIQKEIMRAVTENRRVCIVSGNGVGKTFTVAALELAFLYTHNNATVLHTSRSNGHTRNTTYKELREMLSQAQDEFGLPGTAKKQPMEIDFEDKETRKYEAVSPSNPDGLEGRHNEHFLAVVDEADKKEIDEDVIESAESSLTDDNDKMLVIGNPPRDKGNSLHTLMQSEHWHTIQFSSFDCDNVQIQAGNRDGEIIPGPIQLSEIQYDWEKHHNEDWPGHDEAIAVSAPYVDADGNYSFTECNSCEENDKFREDLAEAWYRRRVGIIPPKSAVENRPFYGTDVDEAVDRWEQVNTESRLTPAQYDAIGVDVAGRGKDKTVIAGITLPAEDAQSRVDVLGRYDRGTETGNAQAIREAINGAEDTPIVFDTVGMGGPVAESFKNEGFNVVRFDGNKKARNDDRYYNMRTESLCEFGNWLHDGAVQPETDIAKELYGVAEALALDEKGLRSGTSYIATSKDELRKEKNYGQSPDFLDAAAMAVWGSNHTGNWGSASWNIYTHEG